jgi:hypothetical protein
MSKRSIERACRPSLRALAEHYGTYSTFGRGEGRARVLGGACGVSVFRPPVCQLPYGSTRARTIHLGSHPLRGRAFLVWLWPGRGRPPAGAGGRGCLSGIRLARLLSTTRRTGQVCSEKRPNRRKRKKC